MTMRRFFAGLLAFGVALGCTYAQTRTKESLRSLAGVYVHVLPLARELEAGGLTTKQVQAEVESSVRRAGIMVYPEPQAGEGSANLAVVIDCVKHPQGPLIYSVEVSLIQQATLVRLPQAGIFAAQT